MPVRIAASDRDVHLLSERVSSADEVSVDTETEVLYGPDGQPLPIEVHGPGPIRVLTVGLRHGADREVWLLDVGRPPSFTRDAAERFGAGDCQTSPLDLSPLAPALAGVSAYGWNADFDEAVLRQIGLEVGRWIDLMVVRALTVQGASGAYLRYPLAKYAEEVLGVSLDKEVRTSYTSSAPLDAALVEYAATDAAVTLLLGEHLMRVVDSLGLAEVVDLELAARPFRAWMERTGIWFDSEGWSRHLAELDVQLGEIEARMRQIASGGDGQLSLLSDELPFNPASPQQVREVLNRVAAKEVKALFGRPLRASDSLQDDVLQRLGHPLAEEVVRWRKIQKLLTTYGEKFLPYVGPDGRVRAKYTQAQVASGRLSSQNPNLQNLAPEMKPFFKAPPGRVFVMADLSQAELRALASVSKDPVLLAQFERGADLHVATASQMFGVDLEKVKSGDLGEAVAAAGDQGRRILERLASELGVSEDQVASSSPERLREELDRFHKERRSVGKTLNFAQIYGLGPRALAETLTTLGVQTTVSEARELRDRYFAAFPQVAEYLKKVYGEVDRVKARVDAGEIDFEESIRVGLEGHAPPLLAPVLVTRTGTPFEWHVRTPAGRRRVFDIRFDQWTGEAAMIAARSEKPLPTRLRKSFEAEAGVALTDGGRPLPWADLKKVFEDRRLRWAWVEYVKSRSPEHAASYLFREAAKGCVQRMANAMRNTPIQGGVADAILAAFGLLYGRLRELDGVCPVQSVHDSIVVEAPEPLASQVAEIVSGSLEEGFRRFFPDVPVSVDVEVASTLG